MKVLHYQKQSGIALFISLIMLLLLTIIGITSMKTTILEEKMAGNMINKGMAFQAAESSLKAGENYLKTVDSTTLVDSFPSANNGLYLPTNALPQRWNIVDWTDATKFVRLADNTLKKVKEQPGYIIEELPTVPENDGSLASGEVVEVSYYRVTSRGVGGTDTAVVMLQSTYKLR